jgi:hypothetical protein
MSQKIIFMTKEILLFDFELFIGARGQKERSDKCFQAISSVVFFSKGISISSY